MIKICMCLSSLIMNLLLSLLTFYQLQFTERNPSSTTLILRFFHGQRVAAKRGQL
ncbi:hypothetical protein RchiOBHm_Chr4g0442991 [Rosa chinensis]|uniref:Uncharacterized protein n=1 Tax=Rosa chinensis TaxID=74649 RepID=A0A2P6R3Q1_ROSCH|nr:hypothetical protein RchiOBHm_Chr4g0442991 [Rosa chinensis]